MRLRWFRRICAVLAFSACLYISVYFTILMFNFFGIEGLDDFTFSSELQWPF